MKAVTTNTSNIPGFDGLRAIACLAVFGVHFQQNAHLEGQYGFFDIARLLENGNTGVALFFALSGFLLSLPFWNSLSPGNAFPAPGKFWLKRLARILPAYYVCLTVLVIANRQWEQGTGWNDIALHYSFLFNYSESSIYSINPPFWTIAIEAQFYLVLPLLFLLLRPAGLHASAVLVALLCAGAYALHFWLMSCAACIGAELPGMIGISRNSAVLTHSLLAHLPHFLLGVLGGWAFLLLQKWKNPYSPILDNSFDLSFWLCAAAVLAILATPLADQLQMPHGRYNFPLVPLLIIVMIVSAPYGLLARTFLETRLLRLIGVVSYGVYIYHLPSQNITARYMKNFGFNAHDNWLLFGVASLLLTLVAAALSYRIIELPLMQVVRKRIRTSTDQP